MIMCAMETRLILFSILLPTLLVSEADGDLMSMLDFRYFRCVMKREWKCPDSEINFFMYTPEYPHKHYIDPRYPKLLHDFGWKSTRKNVLIIHGFNGTHSKTPMTYIRDAYLSRKDYNVFMVDWSVLTRFPCYLSALSNMKKAAQCTAQLYSSITQAGALAKRTTCVGHSLGAHICGMISNHLTEKQYKIVDATPLLVTRGGIRYYAVADTTAGVASATHAVAVATSISNPSPVTDSKVYNNNFKTLFSLDPGRPLVSAYGSKQFRLTRDDAHVVQVIHTNAGFLGESGQIGHVDFCVNGGQTQPGCKGHPMRIARCSHFMSACYFATSISRARRLVGIPCDSRCPKEGGSWGIKPDRRALVIGEDVPDASRGMYCVSFELHADCPFN